MEVDDILLIIIYAEKHKFKTRLKNVNMHYDILNNKIYECIKFSTEL